MRAWLAFLCVAALALAVTLSMPAVAADSPAEAQQDGDTSDSDEPAQQAPPSVDVDPASSAVAPTAGAVPPKVTVPTVTAVQRPLDEGSLVLAGVLIALVALIAVALWRLRDAERDRPYLQSGSDRGRRVSRTTRSR